MTVSINKINKIAGLFVFLLIGCFTFSAPTQVSALSEPTWPSDSLDFHINTQKFADFDREYIDLVLTATGGTSWTSPSSSSSSAAAGEYVPSDHFASAEHPISTSLSVLTFVSAILVIFI